MVETFYEKLAIPESCYLGKRIYKKLLYENASLNATDKKAFSNDIQDIRWQYTLKPETINIARFQDDHREYHEIAVIQVNLKEDRRVKRIAEVIQRAIPYPVFLVLVHGNKIALNVAHKRLSLADKEKMTVEKIIDTGWIDLASLTDAQKQFFQSCKLKSMSFNNFYELYSDMINSIIALNCAALSGSFSLEPDKMISREEALEEIGQLQQKLAELQAGIKKETQFNHQVELNVEIKTIEQKIDSLKNNL